MWASLKLRWTVILCGVPPKKPKMWIVNTQLSPQSKIIWNLSQVLIKDSTSLVPVTSQYWCVNSSKEIWFEINLKKSCILGLKTKSHIKNFTGISDLEIHGFSFKLWDAGKGALKMGFYSPNLVQINLESFTYKAQSDVINGPETIR